MLTETTTAMKLINILVIGLTCVAAASAASFDWYLEPTGVMHTYDDFDSRTYVHT